MIDRETAIQWATDAGVWVDSHGRSIVSNTEALQALITRVQNEAYEKAAKITDECLGDNNLSNLIRALKQTDGELNAKR